MKTKISLLLLILSAIASAKAQQGAAADPSDKMKTLDSAIKTTYEVISGEAGAERNWALFRSLFYDGARLIAVGKNPQTNELRLRVLSPEDYIQQTDPFFKKNGFFEREIGRKTMQYGNIAHVFSAYASFRTASDKAPFARGVNSFQLFFDGKRWWIVTIYWQAETADNPVPKELIGSWN